jgi:DMSO/TMAO reductase YedYZ molybdopterin-dependent catalytic subunit
MVSEEAPYSTGYFEDGRMRARSTRPRGTVVPHGFLTPSDEWGDVERGSPLPYTLPPEVRRRVGLERDTWRVEVIADPDSDSRIEQPLSIDFDALMRLADKHAVRYIKALTCNNIGEPLGVGLWEGVPLRVLIWMARPVENIRRVFYYGYHNDDPAQIFQSSLPIGRALEDPPGELPVMLGYKLNGEFLSGKRGGPVRMIVPESYGFKSVKWLQRIVLTNDWRANDTYALGNNDLESPMKTFARFARMPSDVTANEPFTVFGLAQVGVSGLARVQCSIQPADAPPDEDDPYFECADWREATIQDPPRRWGGGLPNDALPATPLQFDASGAPLTWPLRYAVVHWSIDLPGQPAGQYALRCRTIDSNGIAQPLPRPFAKSGRAEIEVARVTIGN